jgi:hypothetical protein
MSAQASHRGATRLTEGGTELITLSSVARMHAWELTLDAEVPPSSHDVTAERARAVADRLARVPGVAGAAVRPHCGGRFLLAHLVVEAASLADAVDRSAESLRGCALDAGVGPLILVAARYSTADL